MRVFLAGATGVLGIRLVPLLVAQGHVVAGMSRSGANADELIGLGAEPVVCDVYDAQRLISVVDDFGPDVVMHQLTDLPDAPAELRSYGPRNSRMRREGTRNLILAAGGARVIAQSIAFTPVAGDDGSVGQHEAAVLDANGLVVQYGLLYGPGTWMPASVPEGPRIHVDDAARRTVPLLDAPNGVVVLVD